MELEVYGTDPLNPDSDGDGFLDGREINYGSNPNDPNDYPVISSPSPTESSGFRFGLIFGFTIMSLVAFAVWIIDRRRIKYTGEFQASQFLYFFSFNRMKLNENDLESNYFQDLWLVN